MQGRHGARQGQGGHNRGQWEKLRSEPLGVQGNKGGRKASGVDLEYHGVGEGEGVFEGSGVAEKPGEGHHRVGRGVELPQGADTPRVVEAPRGDKTPGAPTASQYQQGGGGQG